MNGTHTKTSFQKGLKCSSEFLVLIGFHIIVTGLCRLVNFAGTLCHVVMFVGAFK